MLGRAWRKGYEEGYQVGYAEGVAEGAIIAYLGHKQIALGTKAETHIRSLGLTQLLALVDALFDFQTRADLDAWLAQAAAQE
ncbi:MAG: DUF4351 domain-containing protein [Thermomicrobiales bacterium]